MTRRSHLALFGLGLWLVTTPIHADTFGGEHCDNSTMPCPDVALSFTPGNGVDTASLLPDIAPASLGDMQFSLIPGDGFGDVVSVFGAAGRAVIATIGHDALPATSADEADGALSRPFAASGLPHPASLALLGAGLLGFQAVRRRRQATG
jgi:hypothetical protein